MIRPLKDWSKDRQILWGTGVFGLVMLVVLFTAWFVRGGPGHQTTGPTVADALTTVPIGIPCLYYILVAERAWTRKLWIAGVVIHCAMLVLVINWLLQYDGMTCVVWPVILIGPPTWTVYALRHDFSADQGCARTRSDPSDSDK